MRSSIGLVALSICAVYWFTPVVRYAVLESLWEAPSVFYLSSEIYEFMLLVSGAPVPFIAQALCCVVSWFVIVKGARLFSSVPQK